VCVIDGGQGLTGTVSLDDLGTPGLQGWALVDDMPYSALGWAVAGGEDLDGDGQPDIAVSAPWYAATPGLGRVYLIFGEPNSAFAGPVLSSK
jgi:hypothetical protein